VFKVPLSEKRALLGAAFASVNEADAAPKIMSAVQTLKKEAPDGPAPPVAPDSPAAQ
jgi:hypothetical protein